MASITSVTLQTLISEVRTQLNQGDRNNSFWSDEELADYLNEGVRVYFADVILNVEGQFVTSTNLNITSGVEAVAMPIDCFAIRSLYKKVTDGFITLPYRNNLTESYSTISGGNGTTYLPYYYFRGNNIILRPLPNFTEANGLLLEYFQFPDTMINGGDVMSAGVSPIFRQVIVAFAIYKAKWKESLVNGVTLYQIAKDNLDMLATNFRNAIKGRSKNPIFTVPYNPE